MATNHLENLVAEWYQYLGYFIRQNINVGLRPRGGYECELDIVAFNPESGHLVHIEPSLDTDTWDKRKERFRRKFDAGREYIPQIFKGIEIPDNIEQIALLLYASKKNHQDIGGGKIQLVSELLNEIVDYFSDKKIAKNAVPEQYSLIRTIQFICQYKDMLFYD